MISITVTQRKGGVGKTTISTHLAAAWAQSGLNVCLIDTDPQGDASRMFGLVPSNGLHKMLVPNEDTGATAEYKDVLKPVPASAYSVPDHPSLGALFVLPSASNTSTIATLTDNPFVLSEHVDNLKKMFDVVVIDTAPTISAFDAYVYLATDYYIYVTECEPLSLKGLREGINQIARFAPQREKFLGASSKLLKIVPNKVDARLVLHKTLLTEMAQEYGTDLISKPVMYRAKFKEATELEQLVYAYAPTSGEAIDLYKLAEDIKQAVQHELS